MEGGEKFYHKASGRIETGNMDPFTEVSRRTSLKRAFSERSPASLQRLRPASLQSPSKSKLVSIEQPQSGPAASKSVYAIQKEALCRELKTSTQIRKQLEEQLLALKSELRSKTEALKRSSPQLELQYNELLVQHSGLATQLSYVTAQLEATTSQLEAATSQLETSEQNLKSEIQHAERVSLSLNACRESSASLEMRYQEVHGKLSDLEADYQGLELAYSAEIAQIGVLKNDHERSREMCAALESEIKVARQEMELAVRSRNEVIEQNEQAEARVLELQTHIEHGSNKLLQLESKLDSQRAEFSLQMTTATQQFAMERDKFRSELAATESEAQKQLELKDEQHQKVFQALSDAKATLSRMEAEIANAQRDRDMLRMTANERQTSQSERIEVLEAELSELRPGCSRAKQLCTQYQAKISALTKRVELAERKASSLQEIERSQRDVLKKKTEENKLFDSQRTELALGLEREKTWAEQLSQQLQRADALNIEFKAEIERNSVDFKSSMEQIRTHSHDLEQVLASSRAENAKLHSELQELRNQHSCRSDEAQKHHDYELKLAEFDKEITRKSRLLLQERKTTRRLQNQIQELKGNIRIVARVRPANHMSQPLVSHLKLQSDEVLLTEIETSANGAHRSKLMRVQFDRVFGPDSTNHEICEETEYLIQSALDGRNVCIFAYGQTGSGKTHTMSGRDGVNVYALQRLVEAANDPYGAIHYDLAVESVEIYNEQLHDLLDEPLTKTGLTSSMNLSIQINSRSGQPELVGARRMKIDSNESAQAVLARAMRNRSTASTQANQHSSRSHFVFSIRITTPSTHGTLHLVDLAGSERLAFSQTTGERLRETQAINTSLSSLGNVINSLLNKKASTHVPYRSSKLTYLLQASLSGTAKTMLLTTLSPEHTSTEETKSTLRFAEKASRATLR